MAKALDLVGHRFGRLRVIERLGRVGDNPAVKWLCVCDCGVQASTPVTRSLMSGASQSCGCATREAAAINGRNTGTHRAKGTKTHNTWVAMKQRCFYSKGKQYKDYGGRGITVCERWLKYENFLADMGERPEGTTLDRLDGDGDYEPGNCRWATYLEQAANTRKSIIVDGKTIQHWSEQTGISHNTLYARYRTYGELFPTQAKAHRFRPLAKESDL